MRRSSYNYREKLTGKYAMRTYSFTEMVEAAIKASIKFPMCHGVESRDSYFYGSNSFNETVSFARSGNPVVTERIRKLVERISGTFSFTSTSDYMMDVTGLCLDVATMLTGNPDHWMQPIETKSLRSDKLIDISTEYSFSGGTNKSDIEFRGALIASLVDALRQRGFSVKLTILHSHSTRGEYSYADGIRYDGFCIRTNLINYGEIPDLSLFAFYMGDVSTYRRLLFSAMNEITGKENTASRCYAAETQPNHKSKFHIESSDGLFNMYGREPSVDDIQRAQEWLETKLKLISEAY